MQIAKMAVFGLVLMGAGCATQVFTLTEHDGRLYAVVELNVLECQRVETLPNGDEWVNRSGFRASPTGPALECEYIPVMVKRPPPPPPRPHSASQRTGLQ